MHDGILGKEAQDEEYIGLGEWIQRISTIAEALRFDKICILFDGLDQLEEDPGKAFDMLKPLLGAPGTLTNSRCAFKFFLPDMLKDQVLNRLGSYRGNFSIYHLDSWPDSMLGTLLIQRLYYYYHRGNRESPVPVERFGNLCDVASPEEAGNIDARLLKAAGGAPRAMIEKAQAIIEEHCGMISDAMVRIPKQLIDTHLPPLSIQHGH
jgi:hypothetical protein